MATRSIEPYRDETLPERLMRWIEILRIRIRTIPCYTENAGSPEGVVTGIPGDRYYDTTDFELYIKSTVGGDTGWLRYLDTPLDDFTVLHQVITSAPSGPDEVITLDYQLGQDIQFTLTADVDIVNFDNLPASGNLAQFEVDLTQDNPARVITWPASILWTGGTIPNITTVDSRHIIHLRTTDGGVTWLGTYAEDFA